MRPYHHAPGNPRPYYPDAADLRAAQAPRGLTPLGWALLGLSGVWAAFLAVVLVVAVGWLGLCAWGLFTAPPLPW